MISARVGLKWGILFGLAICVWTMILHALGWYTDNLHAGKQADIAAIIFPLLAIGLAIAERRRANASGGLTVADGMTTGLITGLVSIPISAAGLWFYHHKVNPEWMDHLVAYESTRLASAGVKADSVGVLMTTLRRSGEDRQQLMGALIGTILISIVISLVFSLILRRSARR